MARRRRHEEHENHERWLVSYADFITLLFAFFVVMYSISSVNEGKYKVLSQALVGVFNEPNRALKPIPVGEESPLTGKAADPIVDDSEQTQAGVGATGDDPLKAIADSVQEAFGDLLKSEQLTIRGNEQWIEIELNSSLLFPSGDAVPSNQAFSIIDRVGKILTRYDNPIHVEGFTDNQPIRTALYPTNWELSSARAASIVRMLAMSGVAPGRLASVGYAEFQPVADNATVEGRAKNRRVVLVISRNLDVRRSLTSTGAKSPSASAEAVGHKPDTNSPAPASSTTPSGTQTAPVQQAPAAPASPVNSPAAAGVK